MPSGYTSAVQRRPDELVGVLTADFQARSEPNFAWKSAVSAVLALPALRGAWPMSSVNHTVADRAIDVSGQANHLTANAGAGQVSFSYDNLAPYGRTLSASTQYLDSTDAGASDWADILANEAYIISTERGLTVGGWFETTDVTTRQALIGKWHPYLLQVGSAASTVRFVVRDVGGAATHSSGDLGTVTNDTWFFVVGRYVPGGVNDDVEVYLNGTWLSNAVATFSPLADTDDEFEIGRRSQGATDYLNGKFSLCFLCACALSDAIVFSLYQQTRVMYGII